MKILHLQQVNTVNVQTFCTVAVLNFPHNLTSKIKVNAHLMLYGVIIGLLHVQYVTCVYNYRGVQWNRFIMNLWGPQ